MRKQLVMAAGCILALPLLFSLSQSDKGINLSPYSTIAMAGHTTAGNWCECGRDGGCICDPGEEPGSQSGAPDSDRNGLNQSTSSVTSGSMPGFDFGSSALVLALAFLLWTRVRA